MGKKKSSYQKMLETYKTKKEKEQELLKKDLIGLYVKKIEYDKDFGGEGIFATITLTNKKKTMKTKIELNLTSSWEDVGEIENIYINEDEIANCPIISDVRLSINDDNEDFRRGSITIFGLNKKLFELNGYTTTTGWDYGQGITLYWYDFDWENYQIS